MSSQPTKVTSNLFPETYSQKKRKISYPQSSGRKRPRIEDNSKEQRREDFNSNLEKSKKAVIRAFKKAKGFEIQKITKRMRRARKLADDMTLTRLTDELGAVKALDFDFLAKYHVCKVLSKDPRITEIGFLHPVPENKYQDAPKSILNVLARLFNSKTVKDTTTGITVQMNRAVRDYSDLSGDRPKGRIIIKMEGEVEEASAPVRAFSNLEFSKFDSEELEYDINNDEGLLPKKEPSKTTLAKKGILKTSTFLPALNMGYISGDSDSDANAEYKEIFGSKNDRSNRRGQRARRKLWEKKYGKNANHLRAESQMKEFRMKQRQKWVVSKEIPVPEKPLHPSWEAKRRMKKQLSSQVKFSGQKIKF